MRDENGWTASADAWIADMDGDTGDWSRRIVLDEPMTARALAATPRTMLDVGCGEGRFCRRLAGHGVATVGLDPMPAMVEAARARHPGGLYLAGHGERLPFADDAFDLVVAYLTLIDIDDHVGAVAEMARVLVPGGRILAANLSAHFTASDGGWTVGADGTPVFAIDRYFEARSAWFSWRGIHVKNWHRPMSATMDAFLGAGLTLTHFAEPQPRGDDATATRYRRVPWFVVMEWRKPR
ncbi:class I SAM-dependent methyltransferase [Acuticoccus sp. I52.16.1]|uniref:class I SAM-dependent methyltransferase n=1 Tax=Acuticoccus sp. I52.16.1 TaxID=2928472 RepID=UPI001FD28510|nr:class I SAM-dependent methyltransferase [Acuticoccus sp. I52.16.1]UOM35210.1 class I SAM-dependent methyltransferase [Acuticoccus sp. I52.16.1]